MIDLYDYPLATIFIAGLLAVFVASEIGWQIGTHASGRGRNNASTLTSAAFGLLALMIGFTFAMSLTRFEARREAVLNEANAIGTTALRARLLPEPHRTETLKLLRDYVKARLDLTAHQISEAEFKTGVERSNTLQEALWQQVKALAAKDSAMVPTGLFIQTVNEMIDDQSKRLAALRNRVPNSALLALFCVAAVASAFGGFAGAMEAKRTRLPVLIMGILATAVILVILDLDRPAAGFIRVSQQPMIDTAAAIDSYVD